MYIMIIDLKPDSNQVLFLIRMNVEYLEFLKFLFKKTLFKFF